MTAKPTAPERLDRIERAIAQIASALRQCSGWHPARNGQPELQAILDQEREAIAVERRPHHAPEQREAVSA
jgi:hypothetical protein